MRITMQQLQEMKARGERFAMLTAYDYSTAKLLDGAGVPALLVGDSLGVTMLGYETTLNTTMEDMVRHTQAVVRGSKRAIVISDMPFLSFQVSPEETVRNAGRLLQEGGSQVVKIEGGRPIAPTVHRLVDVGIPVMGHIGLTPQSVNQLGGYRVQGRQLEDAARLLDDAAALQEAGACAIVLESVPTPLSARITRSLRIPTIGIGAGPHCDAQVQVIQDLLGMFTDFIPRHTRHYAELGSLINEAVQRYAADVVEGSFPTAKESFTMDETVLELLDQRTAAPVSSQG